MKTGMETVYMETGIESAPCVSAFFQLPTIGAETRSLPNKGKSTGKQARSWALVHRDAENYDGCAGAT